ncbi:hypothetical protein LCD36_04860 [Saccharopolyspora sp. 6T]|uniref:hypothetical protein n=1 Tax=Saccharopolyspora sp. 6T TaxID=2877238 RepID=UPI001CD801A7|nr:hypothetical protein [Saccharopolyspora sp. 6T]MCA1185783.1 hypothetical protein [Saccharopolyspora sp. 6T]
MARIRTIKPDFFRSRTIDKLTYEQRLTFIGLWTHCDDEGRCEYDPRLVKADVWPLSDRTSGDIDGDVQALTESSLITHYTVGERSYLQINGWREHQKINRPTPSKLPAPDSGQIAPLTSGDSDSVMTQGVLTEDSPGERKGKEQGTGKGKEQGSAAAAPLPSDETFTTFWSTYPRKDGKADALKAWKKATKAHDADHLVSEAQRWAELWSREGRDKQYIPHASTWLNGERWADEPPAPKLRAVSGGYQPYRDPESTSGYYEDL